MGYERNDRSRGYDDRNRGYGRADDPRDRDRGYGRAARGHDHDDRGFFDRAGDEVRSWFGDEDAERRRRADERYDEHGYGREREFGRNYDRSGDDRDRPARWDSQARHETGNFGLGVPPDAGNGWSFRDRDERRNHDHDPDYRSWRDRQMDSFDRDYADYRRENQSRFESEFGSWRQNRERQRGALGQVREHQEVVGSDGAHVGTVDKVKDSRILLTKDDKDAGGHHHSIPVSWIHDVADKVTITKTAEQAYAAWRDEDRDRDEDGNGGRGGGAHVSNRSFSGTY